VDDQVQSSYRGRKPLAESLGYAEQVSGAVSQSYRLGPKHLATLFPVDETTILSSQHAKTLKEMQTAAQLMPINDPSKFDAKMSALTKLCAPFQADAIAGLKDTFLADWRMALAFDQKLNATLPGLQ
jgi:hypothetical protein